MAMAGTKHAIHFFKKRGARGKAEAFYSIWGCFGCLLLPNYKLKA